MEEWEYELVQVFKYPSATISQIGGAGFDSGWIGPDDGPQTRLIVSSEIIVPCDADCDIMTEQELLNL
jgi:hypothetical protein